MVRTMQHDCGETPSCNFRSTATVNLECEPQLPQQHPVLKRQYSTIGIGNVFVCMNPNELSIPLNHHRRQQKEKWMFPTDYLSSSITAVDVDDDDDDVRATASTTTDTTTAIMGDEMIGQIKCLPEDFIVHEIAVVQGHVQTADTTTTTSIISTTTTTSMQPVVDGSQMKVIDYHHEPQQQQKERKYLMTTVTTSSSETENNTAINNDKLGPELAISTDAILSDTKSTTSASNHTASSNGNSTSTDRPTLTKRSFDNTDLILSKEDCIHRLECLLQNHFHSLTIKDTETDTSGGDDTISNRDGCNMMSLLRDMEEKALRRILAIQTEYHYDVVTETPQLPMSASLLLLPANYFVMEVTLAYPKSNNDITTMEQQQSYKQHKSNIHEYFRRSCPLLIAESSTNHSHNTAARTNNDDAITDTDRNDTNHLDDERYYFYSISIMIDTTFDGLIPYLYAPVEDLPPLYQYAKDGYNGSTTQRSNQRYYGGGGRCGGSRPMDKVGNNGTKIHPTLRLLPNLPRTYRRPIHQLIDQKSNSLLGTETINDYLFVVSHTEGESSTTTTITTTAIYISWTKMAARKASKKRQRDEISGNNGTEKSMQPGQKVVPQPKMMALTKMLCVVKKRQREHLGMVNTISAILKCSSSDIGFAGMKDLQAITHQFGTLNCTAIQRYQQNASVRDMLSQRGIDIVPLHPVAEPLNKGDLIGNSFEIIIRNLRRVQLRFDNTTTATNNHIDVAIGDHVPRSTVYESFIPVDDEHLHCMINRVRTHGFINYYGEQRVGEPGHMSDVGVRAFDIGRAMLQQKFYTAIDLLLTGRRMINGVDLVDKNDVELFRRVWKETNGDAVATTKALPSGSNSVPRERAVLKGLVRYGTDHPLTAFRCLQRNERLFFINAYQSYVWNMMTSERMQRYGNQIVVGDLVLVDGSSNKPMIVTNVDLLDESKKEVFTISNVVLPMPGYDTIYPTNEIGIFYHSFLQKEDVQFDKRAVNDEAKARGSYRRVISHASNLSVERISPLASQNIQDGTTDVNVQLKFDLPKGSYATMLLRELMLKTVSRDAPNCTVTESVK